ncbi:hypothetical protein BgiMline_014564, partial [Biomphalaria glabrata]
MFVRIKAGWTTRRGVPACLTIPYSETSDLEYLFVRMVTPLTRAHFALLRTG